MDVVVVGLGIMTFCRFPFWIEQLLKFDVSYIVIDRPFDTAFFSKFQNILDGMMRMSYACSCLPQTVTNTGKPEYLFVVHHMIDLLDM